MISKQMVQALACPQCHANDLAVRVAEQQEQRILSGTLHCDECGTDYPIQEGVPNLVPTGVLDAEEWRLWKDHLAGFEARRKWREAHPDSLATQVTNRSSALHEAFASFIDVQEGAVLDVGCGPGNFRHQLEDQVTYFGIDPLPLPNTEGFYFAQALAEYIPFEEDTFSDVIVMAALDHFRDLDRFFQEVLRVLRPEGKLHIVQSVHDVTGPISALRVLAHWIKDRSENRATRSKNRAAPKHMTEFSGSSIYQILGRYFDLVAQQSFCKRWYSPTNLFLSLRVRNQADDKVAKSEVLHST